MKRKSMFEENYGRRKLKTDELIAHLYKAGVKGIEIHWRAGGDDGSVEEVKFIPNDRKLSANKYESELEELGWQVYTNHYGGYTAGEFSVTGTCEIILNSDGSYTANSSNSYIEEDQEEYLYNKKTDDWDIPNPDWVEPESDNEEHTDFRLPEISA